MKRLQRRRSDRGHDLLRVVGVVVRNDVGHEGAELDVLLIAGHTDSILAGFCWPVADIA